MTRPTYTRVLLVLCSDGSSHAYADPPVPPLGLREVKPATRGNDRGAYRVYEIAGHSIDVMALPK